MQYKYFRPGSDDLDVIRDVFVYERYKPSWFPINSDSMKTVVDIGGHIGAFTLWAAEQWPDPIIHAYDLISEDHILGF